MTVAIVIGAVGVADRRMTRFAPMAALACYHADLALVINVFNVNNDSNCRLINSYVLP